jgi:hypothetical protein
MCSSCKEHCSEEYTQEVDVTVLDYSDPKDRIHIHRITFDTTKHTFIEDYVIDFLLETYGSTNNLEFMYDDNGPMTIVDHRKEVE